MRGVYSSRSLGNGWRRRLCRLVCRSGGMARGRIGLDGSSWGRGCVRLGMRECSLLESEISLVPMYVLVFRSVSPNDHADRA